MNNKRIKALASFIELDDKIVDIGCDHAYLSKILEEKNISSVASDVVPEIIEKRKKENSKLIKYYLSDGLKSIPENEYNMPVLSGMGSYTIIKILKKSNLKFNKVLTCSNSKYKYLREEMLKLGFIIDKEQIIKENNKFYNIILFKKGNTKYTEKELYIGKNHIDRKMLEEKNKYLRIKYSKIFKDLPDSSEILNELKYL